MYKLNHIIYIYIYMSVCVWVFVLIVKEPWTTDSTSTPFSGSCVKLKKNWYGDAENEQESTEDPDVHNRALVDAFEALHK